MRVKSVAYAAAIVAGSVASGAASAATVAITTTTLNVRSGPGPTYSIITAIPTRGEATIESCIRGSLWCRVSYRGQVGWAYSEYMRPTGRTVTRTTTTVVRQPAAPPPTIEAAAEFGVPAIEYTRDETVGAAPVEEDISGSIAPPAAVAEEENTIIPPEAVRDYVVSHPLAPMYLNGEVVVGAALPESVMLTPVPNYDYEYAYVNQEPVLVEPDTRRIVYVYR